MRNARLARSAFVDIPWIENDQVSFADAVLFSIAYHRSSTFSDPILYWLYLARDFVYFITDVRLLEMKPTLQTIYDIGFCIGNDTATQHIFLEQNCDVRI